MARPTPIDQRGSHSTAGGRAEQSGSLPSQLSTFVGREREAASIITLLLRGEVRLVTLTGPGGVGKTRLGLRVGAEMSEAFGDGVWYVPLAAVRDPGLVAAAIGQALAVREAGHRALTDLIVQVVQDRVALLILDNFEHVIEAAPVVSQLLAGCPRLTCLVTSRSLLRLAGEHAYPVPPLPLPPVAVATTAERAEHSSAVRLFVARAQAAQPSFALTDANAAAVEAICRQLDGLPLALELAAARVRHLSLAELAGQMEAGTRGAALHLLRGGPRDSPARHHTLRDAIAWSYDLLDPSEQAVFRRLAVFVGGCTLEAAAAVATLDGEEQPVVDEGIAGLVDQSLLQRAEGDEGISRYQMLETIREFALAQLAASGEAAAVQAQHAAYFLALAERAESTLLTRNQPTWLARLAREHANLRAALAWFDQAGDTRRGLQLAGAMWRFWFLHGDWQEGRARLEAILALSETRDPAVRPERAKALTGAGWLAHNQGDGAAAQAALEESLATLRQLGRSDGMVEVLLCRGLVARAGGETRRALNLNEEALSLARDRANHAEISEALYHTGLIARERGDYERATALFEEALALQQVSGHRRGEAVALLGLGDVARDRGDTKLVRDYCEASLEGFRELGELWGMAFSLHNLAVAAYGSGERDRAQRLCDESVALFRRLGCATCVAEVMSSLGLIRLALGNRIGALDSLREALPQTPMGLRWIVAAALEGVAQVAAAQGQALQAVALAARADLLRTEIEVPVRPNWAAGLERAMAMARAALGDKAFATAWVTGQGQSLDEAIAEAMKLDLVPDAVVAPPQRRQALSHPFDLSEREAEVLHLLVASKTDREIAEALFISPRTASKHVGAILAKLEVTSRAEAALVAVRHGLLSAADS